MIAAVVMVVVVMVPMAVIFVCVHVCVYLRVCLLTANDLTVEYSCQAAWMCYCSGDGYCEGVAGMKD